MSGKPMTPAPSHQTSAASLATILHAPGVSMVLPALISDAGDTAARLTLEFFTARIPNPHTREAYGRAVFRFCRWCEEQRVPLGSISSPVVAAYLQLLLHQVSAATAKQHLAGLRHWLDWLTERGVLPVNPAASVRGPRHVVREGKTPVLERDEARRLLESLKGSDIASLRDKAMLSTMLFGLVRVGAVVKMRVRDFDDESSHATLLLHEKGGKERRIPAHDFVRDALRSYVAAAGLAPRSKAPLYQSTPRRSGALSGEALHRADVWAMVKRRCAAADLPSTICNHSFRATGITIHHENGGRIEDAAELAGHASTRTTQLYNHTARNCPRSEVERIQL
jgi:integrase/recombinase XerD